MLCCSWSRHSIKARATCIVKAASIQWPCQCSSSVAESNPTSFLIMKRTIHDFFGGRSGAASSSGQQRSVRRSAPAHVQVKPIWTDDVRWTELVDSLADFAPKVVLLELCAGASTAAYALQLLLGQDKVSLAGSFDSDAGLRPVQQAIHGRLIPGIHHLGGAGDILRRPVDSFPDADIIVSGPPCPPYSSLGRRKHFEDNRAAPFWRVIDIIIVKAEQGQLRGFVLENVMGIDQKANGSAKTPLNIIMDELKDSLPECWKVHHMILDSKDFGLPQSRRRVYIVGYKQEASSGGQRSWVRPAKFVMQIPLASLIDSSDRCCRPYTSIQNQNITDWKAAYQECMEQPDRLGQLALVDVSRTPSGRTAWGGGTVHPNVCECLTASGPALHVFSLGEGFPARPDGRALTLDRDLRPAERALLQGFSRSVANCGVQGPAAVRIWGNAMSVPVVGSALARLLQKLDRTWRSDPDAGQHLVSSQRSASGRAQGPAEELGYSQASAASIPSSINSEALSNRCQCNIQKQAILNMHLRFLHANEICQFVNSYVTQWNCIDSTPGNGGVALKGVIGQRTSTSAGQRSGRLRLDKGGRSGTSC